MTPAQSSRVIGRYVLQGVLAAGGMATVYLGRLVGSAGFARAVAIKRMHTQFAKDPEFVAMFVDEARLAGHIRHPNVVSVTDAVSVDGEVLLVMDYVEGETLAALLHRSEARPPMRIVSAIVCDALNGLHAAHEARDANGTPLGIVHRDVSPQNMIVGTDGVTRVLDFGIAKAAGRVQVTRDGQVKGKLAYMAPEQLHGTVTRASDVWAMGVVLWEALTNRRLFAGENPGETVAHVLRSDIRLPSSVDPDLAPYNAVVLKALASPASARFESALDMSIALASCSPRADAHEVAAWLRTVAGDAIDARSELVSKVESGVSLLLDDDVRNGDTATRVETPTSTSGSHSRRRLLTLAAVVLVVMVSVFTLHYTRAARTPVVPASSASSMTHIAGVASTMAVTSEAPPPTALPVQSAQIKPHAVTHPTPSSTKQNPLPEFL